MLNIIKKAVSFAPAHHFLPPNALHFDEAALKREDFAQLAELRTKASASSAMAASTTCSLQVSPMQRSLRLAENLMIAATLAFIGFGLLQFMAPV